MKIEKLTAQQEAILPQFRGEWHRWGTCTDRADRARAEAAIMKMRNRIGVKEVPIFIWCASPATSILAEHFIKSGHLKPLRASLRASLWDSLEDSLWDSLGDSLWASLRASLWDSLGGSLSNQWWGQYDSYWIAFYLFCRDVLKVQYDPEKSADLDLWRDIAQSCCWWSCYRNYVFISDRPTAVYLDDRQVLHCENGPALAFSDGWTVHAWHGTRVPAAWIGDKTALTAKDALSQQNVELRRAACEILGWATVLRDLKAKTIDHDSDPQIGDLLEVNLPDAGRERFLKVHCGTGREFAIPVPPTMRTALEANAWTYDIPKDLLKLKENRT